MTNKPKKPQPKNDTTGRNNFQSPIYAIKMIERFFPKGTKRILEPASGEMRIVKYLKSAGYEVDSSDLFPKHKDCKKQDFLKLSKNEINPETDIVLTNPPFALKDEFIQKCVELGLPFGLLLPLDWSGFIHRAFDEQGCGAIIPDKRINYLTPNILQRINDGETLKKINKKQESDYKKLSDVPPMFISRDMVVNYKSIESVEQKMIAKYSASQFHSFWLHRGMNVKERLTLVNLSNEERLEMI